ncbi:MAG: methyltransferase domain-containing protein [Candidatus Hinthialibacter antarcticus]|nr:methyltransferase domain-containing protein [Candidatus Hinthialibacter antarcticus]
MITNHAWTLDDLLICPKTGAPMRLQGDAYVSEGDDSVRFPIEEGFLRAFVPHEGADEDITQKMKAFYEEHPFPNYDDIDSVGSLIEKSLARGFPNLFNRSIPPHSTVLEVGCGTGQLGNFLSVFQRRVVSVDLCLNSLRLATKFKTENQLDRASFCHMNLFRIPLKPESFDYLICTGVLHSTDDPVGGFRGFVPLVKPGGYMVIGLYNRYCRMKTVMRQWMYPFMGDRVAMFDPYLRQYKVSEEKRKSWIMDQYVNPRESLHTIDEVLQWFDDNGIEFVRALPSAVFGTRPDYDYRKSVFEPEPRGTVLDHLLSQGREMIYDIDGGLFLMIGRKK